MEAGSASAQAEEDTGYSTDEHSENHDEAQDREVSALPSKESSKAQQIARDPIINRGTETSPEVESANGPTKPSPMSGWEMAISADWPSSTASPHEGAKHKPAQPEAQLAPALGPGLPSLYDWSCSRTQDSWFQAGDKLVLLPECRNEDPPQDLTSWTEHTQSQLSLAMSLREDVSQVLYSPLVEKHGQSIFTEASVSSSAMQHKLRKYIQSSEHTNRVLFARIEQTRHTIQQVTTCISSLLKAYHEKDAPLKVVEKRLELRAGRPRKEAIQDYVQDALDAERDVIFKARKSALKHIQDGQHILQSLEDCKAQLIACVKHKRDVVQLDRSCLLFDGFHTEDCILKQKEKAQRAKLHCSEVGSARELMEASVSLQNLSVAFLHDSEELVSTSKRQVEQLGFSTNRSLGKRTADIAQLKRQLEKESVESGSTINKMEQSLETMLSQLQGNATASRPSHRKLSLLLQDPSQRLDPRTMDDVETLEHQTRGVLERAMIAGGNKQGLVGLQKAEHILSPHAAILELSRSRVEEELAKNQSALVIRRLHMLIGKLDGQQEGVGNELAAVRNAKEAVTEAMEERVVWAEERLGQLKVALGQIDADLQNKTAAWNIDVRCTGISVSNIETTVKQSKQSAGSKTKPGNWNWQLHSPRPYRAPLKPEALELLREKVRATSYTGVNGCELDVLFRRFDKSGDGQLDEEELRMALRRTLRIPSSMISDAQVSSLITMLDKDRTGFVGITELVDFLGAESQVSKRTGKSVHGVLGEPANTVGAPGHGGSARGNGGKLAPARPYRPPLKKAALEALRIQIKSASYTGAFGRQLDVVFSRFDKDGSGQLDDDEVRQALRRVLKIPPTMLSDEQVVLLCSHLDTDNSGSVSIQEIINFVGPDTDVSQRTGKTASVARQAWQLLEEEGLPQVSSRRPLSLMQGQDAGKAEPTERGHKAGGALKELANASLPPMSPGRSLVAAANTEPSSFSHGRPDFPSQQPSKPLPNLAG